MSTVPPSPSRVQCNRLFHFDPGGRKGGALAPPPGRPPPLRLAARTVLQVWDYAGRETWNNCEWLEAAGLKPRPSGPSEKSPLAGKVGAGEPEVVDGPEESDCEPV